MSDTIQSVGRALSADVATLNSISHNVANLATPGFRAERTVPSFQAQVDGGHGQAVAIDQADGPLAETGNPLDLALRGRGFFAVQRGEETVLVRGGRFKLDAEGYVTTARGDRVLGESGELQLEDTKVRIDGKGELFSGETAVGRLRIVDVADPSRLLALDGGGFRYDGELQPWNGAVRQGAIEQANVDAAEETLRLLELTRHVESVQRALSIYDQAVGTGISRLGDN